VYVFLLSVELCTTGAIDNCKAITVPPIHMAQICWLWEWGRGNAKAPKGGRGRCDSRQTSEETIHCAHHIGDPSQRTCNNVSHARFVIGSYHMTQLITATRYSER